MTVTVEVINQGSFNLLKAMENIGLIHVQTSPSREDAPSTQEETPSWQRLRGIHKNIPGASVDDFLARCREDKEHELAIEKRQEEERAARRAKLHS